eukprot:2263307-Alexandrium_andersonii.AAC.1
MCIRDRTRPGNRRQVPPLPSAAGPAWLAPRRVGRTSGGGARGGPAVWGAELPLGGASGVPCAALSHECSRRPWSTPPACGS